MSPVHPAGTRVIKTQTIVDRRYKEKYSNFQDIYQLALQAESIFEIDSNGLDVVKITGIAPGSIIYQLGLREGDIIYSICGYPVGNEEEAFSVFQLLKSKDDFSVELVRKNQRITMKFRFD